MQTVKINKPRPTTDITVTNTTQSGGAYAIDLTTGSRIYIPISQAQGYDLEIDDVVRAYLCPNHPNHAHRAEMMCTYIDEVNPEDDLKDWPPEGSYTLIEPPIVEVTTPDQFEVVKTDVGGLEVVTTDADPYAYSTKELDEMIIATLEEGRRKSYPEIFSEITDVTNFSCKDLNDSERSLYDRINSRCLTLHRKGTIAACDIRSATDTRVAYRYYALSIHDL